MKLSFRFLIPILCLSFFAGLTQAQVRTCEGVFAPTASSSILARVKGKLIGEVGVHLPVIGVKIKTEILKSKLESLSNKPFSANTRRWNFWQMQVAGDETIAVLKDSRLDPYLAAWLERAPLPSKAAAHDQLARIEQLRQYVYLTLSDNRSPDTPMRDGRLARLIESPIYEAEKNKMHYFTLGDFIKINRGICRHTALAMKVLLENEGIRAEYVTGEIQFRGEVRKHAWVVVKTPRGRKYILDASTYTDDPVPTEDGHKYAVGYLNGDTAEYLREADPHAGIMRHLQQTDNVSVFFK